MNAIDQPLRRSLGEKIYDACLHREGEHHVFNSGLHGRKLVLDGIQEGTQLYEELINASADKVRRIARGVPLGEIALIGVADGANRFIAPIAERLGEDVMPLFTYKSEDGNVQLTPETTRVISRERLTLAILFDDVGTTGGSVVAPVEHIRQLGAKRSEVLYAVSRKITLAALEAKAISYYSVEDVLLDDFTPQQCATDPDGLCAKGWKLIKRDK